MMDTFHSALVHGRTSFLGTTNLRIGFAMSDRIANIDLAYAKVFDYVLNSTQISSLYSDYDSVVTRAGYVYGTVNENGTLNLSRKFKYHN